MFFRKVDSSITIPKHIAIILDGNGRWAKRRGMPRTFGHQVGIENIKTIALACSEAGVKALSVFAFSTENWKRPKEEVDFLMTMPKEFERRFQDDFQRYDIRVIFSGRKTKLSQENVEIMERMISQTKDRQGMILNICFDYGSYYELTEVIKQIAHEVHRGTTPLEAITPSLIEQHLFTKELPPLDLYIRTSGEIRLSNFLLWQAAYSELYFTKVPWPAFSKKELWKAFRNYHQRERRYGGLKG